MELGGDENCRATGRWILKNDCGDNRKQTRSLRAEVTREAQRRSSKRDGGAHEGNKSYYSHNWKGRKPEAAARGNQRRSDGNGKGWRKKNPDVGICKGMRTRRTRQPSDACFLFCWPRVEGGSTELSHLSQALSEELDVGCHSR
jgi:hypothetical protein